MNANFPGYTLHNRSVWIFALINIFLLYKRIASNMIRNMNNNYHEIVWLFYLSLFSRCCFIVLASISIVRTWTNNRFVEFIMNALFITKEVYFLLLFSSFLAYLYKNEWKPGYFRCWFGGVREWLISSLFKPDPLLSIKHKLKNMKRFN